MSEQTCYRWRREYDGLPVAEAKRLNELDLESAQLQKVVAGEALDDVMLRSSPREL